MNADSLASICNFRLLDERLATGGMPTEGQLRAVALAGVQTVINLALPTSPGALLDERAIVTALGMEYVHIPVNFNAPTPTNFAEFCAAMDARTDRQLFVHCAANYRVSAFMALYRIKKLGWPRDVALTELRQTWEPDETWDRFIAEQLQ